MIRGVIFDLDGLLLDSEPAWSKGDLLFAHKNSISINDEFRKQLMGQGLKENAEIFKRTFKLHKSIEEITQERLECLYSVLFNSLRLMPFAGALLQKLYRKKLILSLATSGHTNELAEKILAGLGIRNYFSRIVGALDVPRGKPNPDIYLKAAEKMELDPPACIVLEDTLNGVKAGLAAQMHVIGVNADSEVRDTMRTIGLSNIYPNLKIPIEIFVQ